MIVAHSLGAIFLHVRKCAGSSIELGLATLCGPDDVITLHHHPDIREQIGARSPQNVNIPLDRMTARKWASWVRRRSRPTFRNHIGAKQLKPLMGRDWDSYFKFASERNPWDKAVSHYFWDTVRSDSSYSADLSSFSAWLRTVPLNTLTQFDTYTINDRIVVDHIVSFESMCDDLAYVWKKLDVDKPPLPRVKSESRPSWARDYRVMYSDPDAEFIANVCHREIDAFGYAFD